jgi:ribonuclease-3
MTSVKGGASVEGVGHELERVLGYRFARPELLVQALRHSSAGPPTNERLEFLGDRVLGLLIADLLLATHPNEVEGVLAPRFNALVREATCATVAVEAGLADRIVMAPSEARSGGRAKAAILGDACEAVIGALFMDGGLDAARAFVVRYWTPKLDAVAGDMRDPKTTLQEWAQARALGVPVYELTSKTGPDHAPHFVIEVKIGTIARAQGEGGSRRLAEQDAARQILLTLEQDS